MTTFMISCIGCIYTNSMYTINTHVYDVIKLLFPYWVPSQPYVC